MSGVVWRHDRGRSTRDGPPLLQLQASPPHHSLVSSPGLRSRAGAVLLDPVSQRASSGCCCCGGRDDTGSVLVRCRVTQVTIAAAAGLALAEGDVLAVVSHDPASGQWPVDGRLRVLPPARAASVPCRHPVPSHHQIPALSCLHPAAPPFITSLHTTTALSYAHHSETLLCVGVSVVDLWLCDLTFMSSD